MINPLLGRGDKKKLNIFGLNKITLYICIPLAKRIGGKALILPDSIRVVHLILVQSV